MKKGGIVTVFGSSKVLAESDEYKRAVELGRMLAAENYQVCTGGYRGIMEAVSKGAKQGKGKTLGITTAQFSGTVNPWIDEEKSFPTWKDRLFGLIEAGDAYVVFGGGTGTLVELFAVWEMTNKKIMQKNFVVYGQIIRKLIDQLRIFPEIIYSPFLKFADSPQAVIQAIQGK